MKGSKKKETRVSDYDRMLQISNRASYSISYNAQPHALLPCGNSVPLASEAFYTWITLAVSEKGYYPGAAQLGHLIRQLDTTAFLGQRFEHIHLRTAHDRETKSYKLDLNTTRAEVINLSADGWNIAPDFDTRFYRPDYSIPHFRPVKVKTKLPKVLEKALTLPEDQSKQLSQWMVDALLPDKQTPVLVITGKARTQAAAKLRIFLDPTICPLLAIPTTKRAMGRLATTNSVMAFSIYKHLTKNAIENLNELRTGMLVDLKDINKRRDPIHALIHRPIIISAEEAPQIHDGQLTIEVNEIQGVWKDEFLGALLNYAVEVIRETQTKECKVYELERAAPDPEPPPVLGPDESYPFR